MAYRLARLRRWPAARAAPSWAARTPTSLRWLA